MTKPKRPTTGQFVSLEDGMKLGFIPGHSLKQGIMVIWQWSPADRGWYYRGVNT
jgi:hypothetical protein